MGGRAARAARGGERLRWALRAAVLLGALAGGCSSQPEEGMRPIPNAHFPVNRALRPGPTPRDTAPQGR